MCRAATSLVHSMRFPMPNFPCDFEIPDDWIAESGIGSFSPDAPAYQSTNDATLISLAEIVPLPRVQTVPKDWRGFERKRLVDVLRGIVAGNAIDPVPMVTLPESDHLVRLSYRYCIRDGFHRYYASIAAGFTCLPATVATLEELLEQSKNLGLRR
jgi:hypothetical protein